jgi:excisionase family DNA binding protein
MTIYTTAEAAKLLKLSTPTLARFRTTGEGPGFIKMGGAVRYRDSDLAEWMNRLARRSTSDCVSK